jgi:hypothetical protein
VPLEWRGYWRSGGRAEPDRRAPRCLFCLASFSCGLGDHFLRRLAPQCLEQSLHARMLLVAEGFRIDCSEPAHDIASAVIFGSAASQPSMVARCGSSFEGMRMRVLYLRFTRRWVARTSPVLAFVASARAKASGSAGPASAAAASPRLAMRPPSSSWHRRISARSATGSRLR